MSEPILNPTSVSSRLSFSLCQISCVAEDPATDVEFPKTLKLPGTPELTLLGLGVRTVSFLGIRVYSVGFYADLNRPDLRVSVTLSHTFTPHSSFSVRSVLT